VNLADAIRQAALRRSADEGQTEATAPPSNVAVPPSPPPAPAKARAQKSEKQATQDEPLEIVPNWGNDTGKLTIETSTEEATEIFASELASDEPTPIHDNFSFGAGNAVRFEIFLSPDQLSCLFRALVATQHSMLTLREAAHYLRIPSSTLELLAADGKIPALHIDSRWRFPKSGIDEWVMLQSFREGEVADAA